MTNIQDVEAAKYISSNFSVAKLLSIILVATGHYFDHLPLWIPVSLGLFVFSFSSGYFSSSRYRGTIDFRKFFLSKLQRLLPALLAINMFLLVFFLIDGRGGIVHPHTVIAWLGLSGFLDWFGIRNESPFGNGLWFFTVLLLFYAVYPAINIASSSRRHAFGFITILALVCILGQAYAPQPYMLWLTVFGFGFGVFANRVSWLPSKMYSWIALAVLVLAFLLANISGYKQYNLIFVALMSIASVAILMSTPLPMRMIGPLALWIPCILEIYLLHTYLFIRSSDIGIFASYLLSMAVILLVSIVLFKIRVGLEEKIICAIDRK